MDLKKEIIPTKIIGWGYAKDNLFDFVSQRDFIHNHISDEAKRIICTPKGQAIRTDNPNAEELNAKADKATEQIGFDKRPFFKGTVMELGLHAAINCLENANVNALELSAIIGASNTGPGYPSLADYIKFGLSETNSFVHGQNNAVCWDETEACTSGSKALHSAINYIKTGEYYKVLVVAAEKATELADKDDWTSSNLFGDGAAAVLIGRADDKKEHCLAYDIVCNPYDGKINYIKKITLKNGKKAFYQEGALVHKTVGKEVPLFLHRIIVENNLIDKIDHVIFHQPSKKTVEFFMNEVKKIWPEFQGTFHIDLSTGNISSASALRIFAKAMQEGKIQSGQKVALVTFGAGISINILIFEI